MESRRRRGRDVDSPRRRVGAVAATRIHQRRRVATRSRDRRAPQLPGAGRVRAARQDEPAADAALLRRARGRRGGGRDEGVAGAPGPLAGQVAALGPQRHHAGHALHGEAGQVLPRLGDGAGARAARRFDPGAAAATCAGRGDAAAAARGYSAEPRRRSERGGSEAPPVSPSRRRRGRWRRRRRGRVAATPRPRRGYSEGPTRREGRISRRNVAEMSPPLGPQDPARPDHRLRRVDAGRGRAQDHGSYSAVRDAGRAARDLRPGRGPHVFIVGAPHASSVCSTRTRRDGSEEDGDSSARRVRARRPSGVCRRDACDGRMREAGGTSNVQRRKNGARLAGRGRRRAGAARGPGPRGCSTSPCSACGGVS